ncbi:type II toxin-antitoxin system VapC family toxin [Methylobacterium isbiliense]|jgi:ribonuclease VapC|uniref:Ribonuclease VapC30 n=1 Tax=Methylobacterium isbiliense TaxID=315478 RepID=A0ABQ4S9W2_9HYPH|nr:type II toxin-antitoxin system VapC family toxin [Methylobacterium isbiliense]MDN3623450.1 type II toxin-antitoxin system VapC family toxin [Methylobacterium isbiliense]GJD99172.1 Ribonuclease VapC30 [Methylobacterium isbiliense]
MSIAIDHPEAEALLAEIEARTGRDPGDLLLDLLRRERDRLARDRTVEPRIAADAFARFGKGRHPAGLNFGDGFADALARTLGAPLLYKGGDFARTDIAPALV